MAQYRWLFFFLLLCPLSKTTYATSKKKIRIGYVDFPPLIYNANSHFPTGLSERLLADYATANDVHLIYTRFQSWTDNVAALRSGEIDLIPAMQESEKRKGDFLFSSPYVRLPVYLVGRADSQAPTDDLYGKRLSCPRGSLLETYLKKKYPRADFYYTDDYLDAMSQVSVGYIDFAVMPLGQASYYLKQELYAKLRVVRKIDFEYQFSIAARKDATELIDSFEQFMAKKGYATVDRYKNEWVEAQAMPWQRALVAVIAGLVLAVIALTALWVVELRKRSHRLETDLSATQAFLSNILEEIPEMVFVRNKAGQFTFVNRAMAENLRQKPEDIIGKTLAEIIPGNLEDEDANSDLVTFETGASTSLVHKFILIPGSTQWLKTFKRLMTTAHGEPQVLGISTDITEQVLEREALKKSEQKWKFALEGSGDGLWDWEIDTGKTVYSKRWKEILGYAADEIANRVEEWERLIHPEDLPKATADVEAHLAGKTPVYVSEQRMLCKNGEYRWVMERGIVVERDPKNRPLRMIGTQIDIQARKISEQKLAQFRALIDQSHDAIYVIDPQTAQYLDSNVMGHAMLGYSLPELLNRTVMDIATHIEDYTVWRQRVYLVSSAGGLVFETGYRRKDGTVLPVEVSVRMHTQGNTTVMIAVARDITVRKNTEMLLRKAKHDAEAASQAKSGFLAVMTHELRTPLNGVVGLANMLALTPLEENQRKYVELIIASGRSLLNIINDTLDYSKIEMGKMQIEIEAFNLHDAVQECLEIIKPTADLKATIVQLQWNRAEIPMMVRSDPNRLKQVLLNLLSNAVKFTENGSVTLSVIAKPVDAKRFSVMFSVKDTGIGISPENQLKLFQPFTQADQTISRKFGGTGLGLSISAQLVRLLGGTLQVESQIGAGSHFYFTLTIDSIEKRNRERAPNERQDAVKELSVAAKYPLRILVAEDNEINQIVAHESLRQLGYDASFAANGIEVLNKCREADFDVIIMDMQMPEMDGLTATRALRREMPQKLVRIIALTANAGREAKDECLQAGMDAFLAKPFSIGELQNTLTSAFHALHKKRP